MITVLGTEEGSQLKLAIIFFKHTTGFDKGADPRNHGNNIKLSINTKTR